MTPVDPLLRLSEIRDLLAAGRTTKADARDADGISIHWSSSRAVMFGIYGALYRCVEGNKERHAVVTALRERIPAGVALAPYTDGLSDAALSKLLEDR